MLCTTPKFETIGYEGSGIRCEQPSANSAAGFLEARMKAVREAMKELDLDGILLTSLFDLAYLTGLTGDDSIGLITEDELILITHPRHGRQAETEAGWLKVVPRQRQANASDAVSGVLAEAKLERVGFECKSATFDEIHSLTCAIAQRRADTELVALDDVLGNIRQVKDAHEIDLIRRSVRAAEEAFTAFIPQVKVGETENYLAGALAFEMRRRGATGSSFPVIMASGAHSSLPHHQPGETAVQANQPLLVDWGAVYKGYCSDLTRTLFIGRVNPKIKQIHGIVLEAQLAAIDFLRPGVTTRQADRVARDIIEKAGFKAQFDHGLGHGIGRQVHELPWMRAVGKEEALRPGMVVTVEPGIYLPGEGGVRIEDDVLITESGHEVLSSLDKHFAGCCVE